MNAGVRHGRDAEIANLRAIADLGVTNVDVDRHCDPRRAPCPQSCSTYSGRDQRPEAFHIEALAVVEIDADERIAAVVLFDLDDIDAAFEELDARYLAGEAAPTRTRGRSSRGAFAALNRHELPAFDAGLGEHRPPRGIAFAPGDLTAYIRATWDLTPDFRVYIEAVHRLSDLGAVVTQVANGTSQEGFEAEWREIDIC